MTNSLVGQIDEIQRRHKERMAAMPPCARCGERPRVTVTSDRCFECSQLRSCSSCGAEVLWDTLSDSSLCEVCDARQEFRRHVPRKLWDASMDGVRAVQPAQLVAPLDEWLRSERPSSLIMSGAVGTGKTYAAAALCRQLTEDGRYPYNRFLFTTVAEMLERLRPGREAIDDYLHTPLLVLDDVGRERLETDWAQETFFMIVDGRWKWGLPIITTTNLAPRFLSSRVGEAVFDRLRDGALGVRFAGESMRRMAS